MPDLPTIDALGDRTLLVRLGERIDAALNARVHALAARLRELPEAVDVVPAFASVAISVADPTRLDEALRARVRALLQDTAASTGTLADDAPVLDLPVDFSLGEDLQRTAEALQLPSQDLVERLCTPVYRVAMLGFLPGFPYLLGLDPALALPRRATPRERVPANSLALGGAQLGIYPCSSPGGWHLLGQIGAVLFDPARSRPALLGPGDRVRLTPA